MPKQEPMGPLVGPGAEAACSKLHVQQQLPDEWNLLASYGEPPALLDRLWG